MIRPIYYNPYTTNSNSGESYFRISHQEMIKYYDCQDKKKIKQVFLVHGEYDVQLNYKEKLLDAGFKNITIPSQNDIVELN